MSVRVSLSLVGVLPLKKLETYWHRQDCKFEIIRLYSGRALLTMKCWCHLAWKPMPSPPSISHPCWCSPSSQLSTPEWHSFLWAHGAPWIASACHLADVIGRCSLSLCCQYPNKLIIKTCRIVYSKPLLRLKTHLSHASKYAELQERGCGVGCESPPFS